MGLLVMVCSEWTLFISGTPAHGAIPILNAFHQEKSNRMALS